MVRQLLQAGTAPDTRDEYGLTGLICAARKGEVEIAEILLNAGADIEARDRRRRTALHHAVAFKRHDFVEFLASRHASMNSTDIHGCTPLDLASMPLDAKMVRILKAQGAERRLSPEPVATDNNSFYFGAGVGGPDLPIEVERIHIQFTQLMHSWRGQYTKAIRVFGFVTYVDGSLIRYTDTMNILGPQKAKRKRDWVEVRIGVPESWWSENEINYKRSIVGAIECGLASMIALLTRNNHQVNEASLIQDWQRVKTEFLSTPAPPFAAERQRAQMLSLVREAANAIAQEKKAGGKRS